MSEQPPEGTPPQDAQPHRAGSALDVLNTAVANSLTAGDTARHQLPSSPGWQVILRAARTNTGTVYIGDSTLAAPGTGVMFDLGPGDSVGLDLANPNALYYLQTVGADRLFCTVLK